MLPAAVTPKNKAILTKISVSIGEKFISIFFTPPANLLREEYSICLASMYQNAIFYAAFR